MLTQKKKKIQKIIIASIFIGFIFASNLFMSNFLIPFNGQGNDVEQFNEDELNPYSSALYDLSDIFITGSGNSLETRTYAVNQSTSENNDQGYFNISAPITDMYLSEGQFNFTFQNNYTTEYVIEEDDALYPQDFFQTYAIETTGFSSDNLIVNEGSEDTSDGNNALFDDIDGTWWGFTSSSNELNYSIRSTYETSDQSNPIIDFDRNNIFGLILNFTYTINISDVSLTLYMKNATSMEWNVVADEFTLDDNDGDSVILEKRFINKNLLFINMSDFSEIRFGLSHVSEDFEFNLVEFGLSAVMGFELPISSQDQVALEFDLRGESSAVNGFHAWIRTLDLSAATGATLNISLYKANRTIARTRTNLENIPLQPNMSTLIYTNNFTYLGDSLTYFEFNLENTSDLSFYNYFIVIKSNASSGTFSLVTIAGKQDAGDTDNIDHQLKMTNNGGNSWDWAAISYPGGSTTHLDASSFKLNVTRGYMPSDFNDTLKLENIDINDMAMSFDPFKDNTPEYGNKEWGKGTCNESFYPHVEAIINNFKLDLTWNNSVIKGFEFNVSYYITGYILDNTDTRYEVQYNGVPIWTLNFTLNTNIPNWNYIEFWYIYPEDMNAMNLTDPDYYEILFNSTNNNGEEPYNETYNIYDKVIVLSNKEGTYSLNLTSSNYLASSQQVHSYINYDGTLWETKGFMSGDDISVSLDVQDHEGKAPISGNANITLFKNKVYNTSLTNNTGSITQDQNYLSYDFNNQSILSVTTSTIKNEVYYLGYFWTNGTAIGCRKAQIYIDDYLLNYDFFRYDNYTGKNQLLLEFENNDFAFKDEYSLLIATVNQTGETNKPSYPILKPNLNEVFSFDHPLIEGNPNFYLSMNSFSQSENILNPEENINFKIELENLVENVNLKLYVKVQLVSFANNDWIIAENQSEIQTLTSDGLGKIKEFDINLAIDSYEELTKTWPGINAPIRKAGAKTIVTIYYVGNFKNYTFGIYESNDYSILTEKNENDFEGYILGLQIKGPTTGNGILTLFERDECIYNQSGLETTVICNYFTTYYTSIYNDYIANYSFILHSKFDNIQTIPADINDEDEFILTSILKTEFGDILSNKDVTCQYQNESGWNDIPSPFDTTDENGKTEFTININDLYNVSDSFSISLYWAGNDTILGIWQIKAIIRNPSISSLSVALSSSSTVYKGVSNTLTLRFTNTGQLTLSIYSNNISIKINEFDTLSYELYYKISLQNLKSGQSVEITILILYLELTNLETLHLNVSVRLEGKTSESNIELSAIFPPYPQNLSIIITLLLVLAIILSWISLVLYRRHINIKISKSLQKPVIKERPRRGTYVKPAELVQPIKTKEKETPKLEKESLEIEEKIEKEKVTTDLDSLLAEKGIEKAPKEIQLTRSSLKKWNLDKLRNFCKKNDIKFKSKDSKSELIEKILSKNKK